MRVPTLIIFALLTLSRPAWAQPAPATAPATAPARYEMTVPAGFEKVTLNNHVAVCKAADADWVKKALVDLKPATRPTTMPVDVLKRTTAARADVVKQMVADLGVADDKEVNALFDEKILPTLKKLDEMKPPVFFLVITRPELRTICKDGWGEPRFHYNRAAGEVSYVDNVMLSIERPMDDSVLPYFYEDKDPIDLRTKNLALGIRHLDTELANLISTQTEPALFNLLTQHISSKCFDVPRMPRDQQWLAMGITGYFAAKYAGELTLQPRDLWLKMMTYEDERFAVSSKPIDLVNPLAPSSMKVAAVPYYDQAMRRKAVTVLAKWAEKAGEAGVTKALVAYKAKPPADGAALVKLITEVSGTDLSKDLAPG